MMLSYRSRAVIDGQSKLGHYPRAVSIAGALPVSLFFAGCVIGRDGRTVMAKGQKRSNREAKKPKADKKKMIASADTAPSALAKPKPGAAKAETKR
jgi:hypothetical protein